MSKTTAVIVVISLFAAAISAQGQAPADQGATRTYYWNHPKLEPVKVNRATGAIVVPGRTGVDAAEKPAGPLQWLDWFRQRNVGH